MIKEKRVRDIVGFSQLVEVDYKNTIKEVVGAALPLLKAGYSPTIVVKEQSKIIGMLCWSDILNVLLPAYAKGEIKMEVFWEGLLFHQWSTIADHNVKDAMRQPVFVDIDDTLAKVAYTLIENKISSILVTDRGKLVGMISAGDLFNELYDDPASGHNVGDDELPLAQ